MGQYASRRTFRLANGANPSIAYKTYRIGRLDAPRSRCHHLCQDERPTDTSSPLGAGTPSGAARAIHGPPPTGGSSGGEGSAAARYRFGPRELKQNEPRFSFPLFRSLQSLFHWKGRGIGLWRKDHVEWR
jgi:hypothetical protein